jgi:hypothetical protein
MVAARPWCKQPAPCPLSGTFLAHSYQLAPGRATHFIDQAPLLPYAVRMSHLSIVPVLLLPRLLTVMMKFPFSISHTVLLWFCVMVMLRSLFHGPVFHAFPPPLPFILLALDLPCRLAADADALLGMVNSELLLGRAGCLQVPLPT